MYFALFILCAGLVGLLVLRRQLRRSIANWVSSREHRAAAEVCRCGYSLRELDVARCPECGRVVGFEATADDLGLTTEQLARVQEKRRARAAEAEQTKA